MKRSDITTAMVLEAAESGTGTLDRLMETTGAPLKVCWRAIEREVDKGLLDYGTSARFAWVVKPPS